MPLVLVRCCGFSKIKIVILLLLFHSVVSFSQQVQKTRFIWVDNSLKASRNENIYIVQDNKTDTIFPSYWKPTLNDTLFFEISSISNPVYIETSFDTTKKRSNKFNLIPKLTYNITEYDDKIEVKLRPIVFDTLDSNAKTLYSFLIKLFIELLVAIPLTALLRLPSRLIFFVFVANIMSFPLIYIPFNSIYPKELLTILVEGIFIFLIGWKRLKFTKALLVSILLNVISFGIYQFVMLIIKIL